MAEAYTGGNAPINLLQDAIARMQTGPTASRPSIVTGKLNLYYDTTINNMLGGYGPQLGWQVLGRAEPFTGGNYQHPLFAEAMKGVPSFSTATRPVVPNAAVVFIVDTTIDRLIYSPPGSMTWRDLAGNPV